MRSMTARRLFLTRHWPILPRTWHREKRRWVDCLPYLLECTNPVVPDVRSEQLRHLPFHFFFEHSCEVRHIRVCCDQRAHRAHQGAHSANHERSEVRRDRRDFVFHVQLLP